MTIRINNINLSIDDPKELVKKKAAKALRISEDEIINYTIIKESIDARKKDNIKFNYCVDVNCNGEKRILSKAK